MSGKTLLSYKNKHNGEWCLVCGLGPSLVNLIGMPFMDISTFGVNDIVEIFTPTYHIIGDSYFAKQQFKNPEYYKKSQNILNTKSEHIFSVIPIRGRDTILLPLSALWQKNARDIFAENRIPAFQKTVVVCLGLAIYMGFKIIGMIGVDYRGQRIVCPESNTPISQTLLRKYNKYMRDLDDYAKSIDVDILNLSKISRVTAFRKVTPAKFFKEWAKETNHT